MRFTVRRPARAEVSPCCHRPPGGDIACGVHVGITRPRVAGLALEDRLALAVSGRYVPTGRASLRRVRGRDSLRPAISFVLQPHRQQTPTTTADASIQAAFLRHPCPGPVKGSARTAGHRPHVESFHANHIEAPCDVGGGLFDPVLAPIGLARNELRNGQLGVGSPARTPLGAGQAPLQHFQPFRFARGEGGRVQQFTGRQGRRYRHTSVDTHHAAVAGTRDWVGYVREGDMPTASPIAGDAIRLHAFRDRSRQEKAYPADFGYPYPTEPTAHTLDMVRSHADLSKSLVHTGFAPRRAAVRSGEEVPHGMGKVAQRLLLHSLRTRCQPFVLGTGGGQLGALLAITRRMASRLPVPLLLDGQVPHKPSVTTMSGQRHRLIGGRKQPVSRHAGNVAIDTDKTPEGDATLHPAKGKGDRVATLR